MFYDDIKLLVHGKPFRPFRIHIDDGSRYDVRLLEGFILTRAYMTVALPSDPNTAEPDFVRVTNIDLMHISQIEPLPVPISPAGNGQSA